MNIYFEVVNIELLIASVMVRSDPLIQTRIYAGF